MIVTFKMGNFWHHNYRVGPLQQHSKAPASAQPQVAVPKEQAMKITGGTGQQQPPPQQPEGKQAQEQEPSTLAPSPPPHEHAQHIHQPSVKSTAEVALPGSSVTHFFIRCVVCGIRGKNSSALSTALPSPLFPLTPHTIFYDPCCHQSQPEHRRGPGKCDLSGA